MALGFGRVNAVAVRDLAPLERPPASDVEIRVATPEELDSVDRLVDEEAVFHAGSPMFRPYRRDETADAVRAELATELASDDHAFLIAPADGQRRRRHLRRARRRLAAVRARRRRLHGGDCGDARRAGIGRRRSARRGGVRLGQRPRAPRRVPAFSRRRTRSRRRFGQASASLPSWSTYDGASTSASSPVALSPDRRRPASYGAVTIGGRASDTPPLVANGPVRSTSVAEPIEMPSASICCATSRPTHSPTG